jgi:hypothetical protein
VDSIQSVEMIIILNLAVHALKATFHSLQLAVDSRHQKTKRSQLKKFRNIFRQDVRTVNLAQIVATMKTRFASMDHASKTYAQNIATVHPTVTFIMELWSVLASLTIRIIHLSTSKLKSVYNLSILVRLKR